MIRLYIYDEQQRQFSLIEQLDYHNRCLLAAAYIVCPFTAPVDGIKTVILCSSATDGFIILWSLSDIIRNWLVHGKVSKMPSYASKENESSNAASEEHIVQPLLSIKAHQSGINSLSTVTVSEGGAFIALIASCGDDGALSVARCSIAHDGSVKVMSQTHEPNAHHSAVTGMC